MSDKTTPYHVRMKRERLVLIDVHKQITPRFEGNRLTNLPAIMTHRLIQNIHYKTNTLPTNIARKIRFYRYSTHTEINIYIQSQPQHTTSNTNYSSTIDTN